jgi:hypothetical protein
MNATVKPFVFKPAVLHEEHLIIGLAGGTGSGKTYTGMRLAKGLAGGKRFAVIDTEAGRAKHYARQFAFDHGDLAPPFRPDAYKEAILAAVAAGYPVIMVDSMTHVWDGEGGVLDWQEEELDRMAGQDWQKREACKMAAWIQPKKSHKKMVSRLLQIRAHLILCFRAEEKIEMVRDTESRKMKIVPKQSLAGLNGWIPICEKKLPFELTASFLLTNDQPGFPKPIKLEEQHRALFPLDRPIDESSGEAIARWAKGGDESGAPSEADQLLDGYARCANKVAFDALEKRRIEFWKSGSPLKARVKEASDAAARRLKEASSRTDSTDQGGGKAEKVPEGDGRASPSGSVTDAEWVTSFNEQTSSLELDVIWKRCLEAFKDHVPPEIYDAYEGIRERLVEREATRTDDY